MKVSTLRLGDLRSLYESYGSACIDTLIEKVRKKELDLTTRFSLKMLWEGLVGEAALTLQSPVALREDAVRVDDFRRLTSAALDTAFRDGYLASAGVGERLVTTVKNVYQSVQHDQPSSLGVLKRVKEGEPYPDTSFGDRYCESQAFKFGRSVKITREAILRDQSGQLQARARSIGQLAAARKDEIILTAIEDAVHPETGRQAYYPEGAQEALYRSSAGSDANYAYAINLVASNGLATKENIAAAWQTLAKMTDRDGNPIDVMDGVPMLLVPRELEITAREIVNAVLVELINTNVHTQTVNQFSGIEVFGTPRLADGTTWYYGFFPKQFVWHEVWPIEFRQASEAERGGMDFDSDVIVAFRGGFYGGCNAIDDKYVVKNTA
ncbi:MAG: Mu-like prophage major head subunit gpT family protein [Planctomycetota bacterium]